MTHAHPAIGRYEIPNDALPSWELPEETMPESAEHNEVVRLLEAILRYWASRSDDIAVYHNLALKFDPGRPRIGVDPDICVVSPEPPDAKTLVSLHTWEEGHHPPRFAIEVVSESNSQKDYELAPRKYDVCGAQELCIFDPLLVGSRKRTGPPSRLQVYRRDERGAFPCVYKGDGPVHSEALGAFLVATDEGRKLRIADERDGTKLWLTGEEAERAAKEAERAAKEAALARVAELEALLAHARAGGSPR